VCRLAEVLPLTSSLKEIAACTWYVSGAAEQIACALAVASPLQFASTAL
jgi:hypothetical protein